MTAINVSVEYCPESVCILTLDRPPVNALNVDLLTSVNETLAELQSHAGVRSVVITGAGKTFSGGMDLKELQGFTIEDQTDMVEVLSRLIGRLYGFAKPVIAAINGHAIAGGLLLLLGTDFRVASASAMVGLAEVRVGVQYPLAGLALVERELSPGARRRLMLGGNSVTAEAAERMGIIDEVVEPAAVMDRARAIAEDFAKIPPATFAAVKTQLRSETLAYLDDIAARRSDPMLRGWFTDETKEAARAILAARTK